MSERQLSMEPPSLREQMTEAFAEQACRRPGSLSTPSAVMDLCAEVAREFYEGAGHVPGEGAA